MLMLSVIMLNVTYAERLNDIYDAECHYAKSSKMILKCRTINLQNLKKFSPIFSHFCRIFFNWLELQLSKQMQIQNKSDFYCKSSTIKISTATIIPYNGSRCLSERIVLNYLGNQFLARQFRKIDLDRRQLPQCGIIIAV